jgi:hypothetical protein
MSDFTPYAHPTGCCLCSNGEVWKYFKNEAEMVVDQVYHYCPFCLPDLARPIIPNQGQVEIGYEEFNRLSQTKGWSVD